MLCENHFELFPVRFVYSFREIFDEIRRRIYFRFLFFLCYHSTIAISRIYKSKAHPFSLFYTIQKPHHSPPHLYHHFTPPIHELSASLCHPNLTFRLSPQP